MYTSAENAIFAAYQKAGVYLGPPRNGPQTEAIPKYEGVAGAITRHPTSIVTIKWANQTVVFSDGTTDLTHNRAKSFSDQIDKMYVGSEHTNVNKTKSGRRCTSATTGR
jgi:hypothetical protein